MVDKAVGEWHRQSFGPRPWRFFGSLLPGEVDLGEPGGIILHAERHFVATTASRDRDDRLPEQRVSLGDLCPQLRFKRGPGFRVGDERPRLGKGLGLPLEQVVVAGIQSAVGPRAFIAFDPPGKAATNRTASKFADRPAPCACVRAGYGLSQDSAG